MPSEYDDDLIREAKNGDQNALSDLLCGYQRMIHILAGRMLHAGVSREDLIQAGSLGLMHAIMHYDAMHDVKLSTYAVPWILGEMRRAVRRAQVSVFSLDRPMDGNNQTLQDTLVGESGVDLDSLDLRMALSRLERDEQILICLRYYRDKTQKETAQMLRKSQAQISRMERRALDALHTMLRVSK